MKTLAILSRKGGTGKTTLALHLAVEAEAAGHTTAVIDLDSQASATGWGDTRSDDTPAVISAHSTRLKQILYTAEQNGVTLAILDTPPKVEDVAQDAAFSASFAVIPCRPERFDLEAIRATTLIVERSNLPACIVMNQVRPRSAIFINAKKAVKTYKIPCAPVDIGNRVAFSYALIDGKVAQEIEPTGKASREIRALYKYIAKEMEI